MYFDFKILILILWVATHQLVVGNQSRTIMRNDPFIKSVTIIGKNNITIDEFDNDEQYSIPTIELDFPIIGFAFDLMPGVIIKSYQCTILAELQFETSKKSLLLARCENKACRGPLGSVFHKNYISGLSDIEELNNSVMHLDITCSEINENNLDPFVYINEAFKIKTT
ncbi:hypothetical protein HMI54_009699 [Coelomomyces lativittatus]|nr:hypothetical protein HMI55_005561 [Coelomomyces lativittatus]KAJ1500466.1 hypothetical protein HMI56_003805 [Coelomomyces lativittatus]KAJ1501760.1 hypothetical protein HMI54_009699 [Coelomomyces lativittatus]